MKTRRIKCGIRKTAAQTLFARTQALAFYHQPAYWPDTIQMRAVTGDRVLLAMPTMQIRRLRMSADRDNRYAQDQVIQVIGASIDLADLFRCKSRISAEVKVCPIGAARRQPSAGLNSIRPGHADSDVMGMRCDMAEHLACATIRINTHCDVLTNMPIA